MEDGRGTRDLELGESKGAEAGKVNRPVEMKTRDETEHSAEGLRPYILR